MIAILWDNATLSTSQVITSSFFIPSLGVVGQWSLDEMSGTLAYDSSGYEHHGQLLGGPTWTSGQQRAEPGRPGRPRVDQRLGLDFYLRTPLTATIAPEQGWFIDDVLVDE
jgi:hypothetical protein